MEVIQRKHVFSATVIACCVCLFYIVLNGNVKSFDNILHPSRIDRPRSCLDSDLFTQKRNKQRTNGSILIGIRLTDRTGYSEFTASVIRKYLKIPDSDIIVFTTRGWDCNQTRLRDWYGESIRISEVASDAAAANYMLRVFVQIRYKVLFLIDSEMALLPTWRDYITRHMITNKTTPFLSLYHSANMHSDKSDCEESDGDHCKGKIVGKYGVAITNDFARVLVGISSHTFLSEFDWNELLRIQNLSGVYPKKSLIIQIGQTDQDKHYCGQTDVPYEFQLCDLPMWVRGGIEFFVDRCTNPQELYSPELANHPTELSGRMWTRPVISYSLYGSKTRYTDGAIVNAKRVFRIYPGWKIWMYIDNSVPAKILHQLCSKSVRFINVTGTKIRNQMSWRFLIASEPVKMFTILDIDYRILARGKEAVDDWIKSGRKFHVMRDHPNHSRYPMSGGMWGGMGKSIPNIKELILKYSGNNNYMVDMNFLNGVIWPIVKQSAWVHDSNSLHKFGEDHPFPTKSKKGEFVGSVNFH